jgi:hypothetical protein
MAKRKTPSLPKPVPDYEGVEEFVRLTDYNRHRCRSCQEGFGGGTLEWQVTHYLKAHKFKLLYICQEEQGEDDSGYTVAYVGGPAATPTPAT